MTLLHCPLCIGLAVLSVLRAVAHLSLVLLSLKASGPRPGRLGPTPALAPQARIAPACS